MIIQDYADSHEHSEVHLGLNMLIDSQVIALPLLPLNTFPQSPPIERPSIFWIVSYQSKTISHPTKILNFHITRTFPRRFHA